MQVVYYNLDKREKLRIDDFAGIITKSLAYGAAMKGTRWNLVQPNEKQVQTVIEINVGLNVLLCNSSNYPGEQTHQIDDKWIGRWHGDRIFAKLIGYGTGSMPDPTQTRNFDDITNKVREVGKNHLKNEQILK